MKTINKTRSTNNFCFTSCHVEHMVVINEHYGTKLVALAHDDNDELYIYTVRVIEENGDIMDYKISTFRNRVEILETEEILTEAMKVKAKEILARHA